MQVATDIDGYAK